MAAWAREIQLGPYILIEPIGEGGMGEVWRARDTRLDRIVAIKRLKGEHNSRFQPEARAIAALNHPHICVLYDVGPDYLVMEYLDGRPVSGPMPLQEALQVAGQIAGALEAAHVRGILHRDLKPANVMITAAGAKLLDFGLARMTSASGPDALTTVEGTISGTAAYMSPEQAQGKALDERSDVFSFGAVLYEMLSGARAFGGESLLDTLNAVVRQEPARLQSPAAEIVKRCLRKDQEARFQSMAEVRVALGQIAASTMDAAPSIAVLPFANMSGDKDQEYFSDGLAEEIINLLAHIPGLKVTARTSAFSFKGKNLKIAQIAGELGVEHILEGSVRKAGTRIRITAQLINAADGFHLWSERYDRELNDIFAVQDEISAAIATVLEAKLAVKPEGRKQYIPNVGAYEAYLKGRHYLWKAHAGLINGLIKSRECYEEAISLDPLFALPHAALAENFHIAASIIMAPEEALARGRAAAHRALELDPGLPEANAWLGIFAVIFDYDWKEADRRFRLALMRQPALPEIRHLYGYFYLRLVGRAKESVAEHRRALEEDPLNLIIRVGLAVSLRAAGRDREASEEAHRIVEFDPNFHATYTLQAFDFIKEPLADALALAEKGLSLGSGQASNPGLLAGLLVRNGENERARELLRPLHSGENPRAAIGLALFHCVCGEVEGAAEWTERAIEARDQLVAMLLLTPPYSPILRRSSRWPALAKRMNLPEAE
jgi:eukaryotic-like serine/threonine-protein kinase